jgi:hypothetical protein
MTDWQPIETAPKDGSVILAIGDGWESEQQIVFVKGYHHDLNEECGWWEFVDGSLPPVANPAEWMPLPASACAGG